jgi:DNA-binding NtrC family response regulator
MMTRRNLVDSLILTAGLDACCADRITDRFSAQQYCIVPRSKVSNLPQIIRNKKPDLVILGAHDQSIEKHLALIRKIKFLDRRIPIILINSESSEVRAIAAFRAGVKDYFSKPISYRQLCKSIDRLLDIKDNRSIVSERRSGGNAPLMIGESKVMKGIKAYLARVATTNSTVMISGETGTGKELAAAMVHYNSQRSRGPFVCVNCAALPADLVESELFGHKKGAFTGAFGTKKGKLELASGGTLFLDEIGDMNPFSQAKILRCVENQKVYPLGAHEAVPIDVRIVSATNQDPEMLIEDGKFRPDLYYRLNVARVQLPPLRERKEDIPQLISNPADVKQLYENIKVSMEAYEKRYGSIYKDNTKEDHQ